MAGEMLFTLPEPVVFTLNPKFSRSKVALFFVFPNMFGTNTNSGPFETANSILLPFPIESEFSGD